MHYHPCSHCEYGCDEVQGGNEDTDFGQEGGQNEGKGRLPVQTRPLKDVEEPEEVVVGDGVHEPRGTGQGLEPRPRRGEEGSN